MTTNTPPKNQKGWRGLLTYDLGAKIVALLAAGVLWFFASEDRRTIIEQTYDVPITQRDNTATEDTTRALSGINPSSIKVTLSGKPERLREVRGEMIEAVLDVTNIPQGAFNEVVTVTTPSDTQIVRINPERVQGTIDIVESRSFAVSISSYDTTSAVNPRYQVQPSEVQVSGPSTQVKQVQSVIYAPVQLAPQEQKTAALIAVDDEGKPVADLQIMPSSVQITRMDTGNLPYKEVPVVLAAPPSNLRVIKNQLSLEKVRLIGPSEVLSSIEEVNGIADYRAGKYTAPVRLLTPSGVQSLDRVNVELELSE